MLEKQQPVGKLAPIDRFVNQVCGLPEALWENRSGLVAET
jgi:hypothetical protein